MNSPNLSLWSVVAIAILLGCAPVPRSHADEAACQRAKSLMAEAQKADSGERQAELLQQAVELCPSAPAYGNLGEVLSSLSRHDEAARAFDNAFGLAATDTQRAAALAHKAAELTQLGRPGEATAAYDLAAELYRAGGSAPPEPFLTAYRNFAARRTAEVVPAAELRAALETRRGYRSSLQVIGRQQDSPISIHVLFPYNSADLDSAGQAQAKQLGEALAGDQFRDYRIQLVGHTDVRGSDDHNQGLSEGRADSVKDFIQRNFAGLKGRLSSSGKGKKEPRFPGNTEEDHRQNRRVEVVLSDAK